MYLKIKYVIGNIKIKLIKNIDRTTIRVRFSSKCENQFYEPHESKIINFPTTNPTQIVLKFKIFTKMIKEKTFS